MRCKIVNNNWFSYTEGMSDKYGWGNGYIYIPLSHPAANLSVSELYSLFGEYLKNLQPITYGNVSEDKKEWCIGFDTIYNRYNKHNFPKEKVMDETLKMAYVFSMIGFLYRKNN